MRIIKAYNVLSFYLTNTKDYDKTAVANSMADNGAVLNMPNGADGEDTLKDIEVLRFTDKDVEVGSIK